MSRLKIQKNKEKILKLLNETIDLEYNLNLKRFKRFSEETRNIGTKRQPEEAKIKIGYWNEYFKDEDRPNEKGVKIERAEIIEVNGEKSYGWRKIKYYTIDDI
jgi:transposase